MRSDLSHDAALAQARERLRERDLDGAAALLEALADSPEAALMLGAVRAEQRDFARALAHLDHAFRLQPAQTPASCLLYAHVLLDAALPGRAEAQARAAVAAQPRFAPALNALGAALEAQDRLEEAIDAYRAAAEADPAYAHARPAEARALWRLARRTPLERSIEVLRRALALDPANADAWNDLGNALANVARHDESRAAYREALRVRPGYHQVESNLLIALHYDAALDADAIFEAHRAWARRHAAGIAPLALASRPASAKLRVGLLSPNFTPGPTASFLLPLAVNLDRDRFELVAYNVGPVDDLEPRLAAAIGRWRHVAALDDAALAQAIAGDAIDVLVDLAGHTPGGRLLAVARRPARAVVEWLDYFDTTGLDAVDAIVGDPVSTPPGSPQRFSERVALIDPCRFCFAPPAHAPAVAPTPALAKGHVTFGSFNRLSKIPAPVVALWARVLQAVPGSRLLVKNNALADPAARERFARVLQDHGIEGPRFELRGPSEHGAMLAEYGDMDIALDTFPYNGGLTTCEALWMGVPVVALLGDAMIGRQSASMLLAAGMREWVARHAGDYVHRAQAFATDATALARSRAQRRGLLAGSPLTDGPRFARAFGAILEQAAR